MCLLWYEQRKAVFKALKWYLKGTTTNISEGEERELELRGMKKGVEKILDWLYTSEKDFWHYGLCSIDVVDIEKDISE